MAFILNSDIGEVRTREDVERQEQRWREYRDYLVSVREQMPTSAYEFASAPWRNDMHDSRSLHDSWVDSLAIREIASGERHEIRSLEIEIRVLGPQHDGNTTLSYPDVHFYSLDTTLGCRSPGALGHGDWLRDEIRLSERNKVLHEIEFSHGSRWIIECADIRWTWERFASATRG